MSVIEFEILLGFYGQRYVLLSEVCYLQKRNACNIHFDLLVGLIYYFLIVLVVASLQRKHKREIKLIGV